MKYLIIVYVLLITACTASMPNTVETTTSNVDGSRQVTMQPGFVYTSADFNSAGNFKLGLIWNSNHPNHIIIIAEIPNSVTSIASNDGLQFNVDGHIRRLSSGQIFTDVDIDRIQRTTDKKSIKIFTTTKKFIEKFLMADSVKVKLVTSDGYYDGDFLADKPSAAIRGFKDFIAQISTDT